jgi:NTE family protein
MAFLDSTVVTVSFPAIARSFPGASLSDLSWVLNAYNVVIAAFLIPVGRLADRIGRRRVFLLGLALFTSASLLCALAPGLWWLVGARVLQAAGAAMLLPTSLALLLPEFPPERRQAAVAVWGAVAAVAVGIGPSLGGLLTQEATWRWVFLINVPIGVVALILGARHLREAREPGAARPDVLGGAALALGIGALTLALVKGEDWGWTSASTLGAFAAAIVLVAAAVLAGRRSSAPVLDPRLLRLRAVSVGGIGTLLFATAFFAGTLNNILFLTGQWHWSVLHAGLAITPSPLVAAVVAGPAGRLADRFGAARVVAPGAVVYVAGVLLLRHLAGGDPSFLAHWLPGAVLVGVGVGACFPTLGGASLVGVTQERFAAASAVNSAARQLGAVLGVSLLVVVQTAAGRDVLERAEAGWLLAAGAATACGLVALALRRPAEARS